MITFYNCLLSVDYKYKEYLVLSLLYAVCGLGLSVVLITTVFREQGYLGRILGTLVPAVLMGIYIIARMFRRARPCVNPRLLGLRTEDQSAHCAARTRAAAACAV